LGLRESNYEATEENCILRNFIIFAHHQILLGMKSRRIRTPWRVTHMPERRGRKFLQGFGREAKMNWSTWET